MIVRAQALDGSTPAAQRALRGDAELSTRPGGLCVRIAVHGFHRAHAGAGADARRSSTRARAARFRSCSTPTPSTGSACRSTAHGDVWTDSIRRNAFSLAAKSTPIRDLTSRGLDRGAPPLARPGSPRVRERRWPLAAGVSRSRDDGRRPAVLAVRKTLDVTSLLPDGARVFAEADYVDPYTLRNDLYIEHGGSTAVSRTARG